MCPRRFPLSPTKIRVLCVEDNVDTRELLKIILEGRNFHVTTADGVETALSAAKSVQFDLFIVDSWLRDGSGIELCTKLQTFRPTTPVLFYSGAAFEKDKRAALACGAKGYLIKPVDPEILVAEVERITATARSAKDVVF